MFAVIKTGGKQYKVKKGDEIKIEKIKGEKGDKVEFDKVLLLADEKAKDFSIGQPYLEGVKVEGKILEQGRAKKVMIVKYKPKSRYRRKVGHRQPYTKVKINEILTTKS
jgi:large subunit ribosomal protein L21